MSGRYSGAESSKTVHELSRLDECDMPNIIPARLDYLVTGLTSIRVVSALYGVLGARFLLGTDWVKVLRFGTSFFGMTRARWHRGGSSMGPCDRVQRPVRGCRSLPV